MTGADELASLEEDVDRLRISATRDVSVALAELLARDSTRTRATLLGRWRVDYPRATAQLLRVIAGDETTATELSPTVVACEVLPSEAVDDVLAVAFPRLQGAVREAAADRPGLRSRIGSANESDHSLPEPDPQWMWPDGQAFPPSYTIEGVKARLNFLGLGAGPVEGEWTELARRAFVRWQVLNGFDPNGELDDDATGYLALSTPEAPEAPE